MGAISFAVCALVGIATILVKGFQCTQWCCCGSNKTPGATKEPPYQQHELCFELPDGKQFQHSMNGNAWIGTINDEIWDCRNSSRLPSAAQKWVDDLPSGGSVMVVASWMSDQLPEMQERPERIVDPFRSRRHSIGDFIGDAIIKLEARTVKQHFDDTVTAYRREASESDTRESAPTWVNRDTYVIHNSLHREEK